MAGSRSCSRRPCDSAGAVVITTGTFLRAVMHTGESQSEGGRAGEGTSTGISSDLARLGLVLGRLKTGTPPRLAADRALDFLGPIASGLGGATFPRVGVILGEFRLEFPFQAVTNEAHAGVAFVRHGRNSNRPAINWLADHVECCRDRDCQWTA